MTLCGSQNRSFQNQARIPAIFALSAPAAASSPPRLAPPRVRVRVAVAEDARLPARPGAAATPPRSAAAAAAALPRSRLPPAALGWGRLGSRKASRSDWLLPAPASQPRAPLPLRPALPPCVVRAPRRLCALGGWKLCEPELESGEDASLAAVQTGSRRQGGGRRVPSRLGRPG